MFCRCEILKNVFYVITTKLGLFILRRHVNILFSFASNFISNNFIQVDRSSWITETISGPCFGSLRRTSNHWSTINLDSRIALVRSDRIEVTAIDPIIIKQYTEQHCNRRIPLPNIHKN